jgi:acetyl esterase/lipase
MVFEIHESRRESFALRTPRARAIRAIITFFVVALAALPTRSWAATPDYANVVYAYTPRGEPLWLDLYLPTAVTGPLPVIVFIHGGGWSGGSKAETPEFILNQGFIVAGINYRLTANNVAGNSTSAARWPAQIDDVKAAIRYVRSLAGSRLGKTGTVTVDGNRIGVYGFSAGGHLAALLGTTGNSELNDRVLQPPGGHSAAEFSAISTAVQAVCDVAGPADLTWGWTNAWMNQNYLTATDSGYAALLGGPVGKNLALADSASSVAYIDGDEPPFLVIHGNLDTTVDPAQSQELDQILRASGVSSTLHIVFGVLGNPPWSSETSAIVQFFKQKL